MKGGIRIKLQLLSLLPASLTLLVLLVHFGWQQYSSLGDALRERGNAIARQLAPACEYGVFSGNRKILQGLAEAAGREKDVARVFVFDRNGDVLAYAPISQSMPDRLSDISAPHVYKASIHGSALDVDSDDIYGMATHSRSERKLIGTVLVRMDTSRTDGEQRYVLLQTLVISIIGLIAIGLLAQRMAGDLSVPIMRLTESVARIESGELGHRIQGDFDGELGVLERAINQMAKSMQRSREKERESADDALHLERIRAQAALDAISDGVITTDSHGRVVYMNPAARAVLDCDPDGYEGVSLYDLFHLKAPNGQGGDVYPLEACLQRGMKVESNGSHLLVNQNGDKRLVRDTASPLFDRNGNVSGAVVVFQDISELKKLAEAALIS
ncbi:MAG: PAS domain-containing protein [Gammaproteobacteria bacterium]|nr:PAS domain-containing protein [Gammaproteobacteria bacterium]